MPGPGRPFQPGNNANPKGRPKKDRALTAILEAAGNLRVTTDDGEAAGKKLLAQHVWNIVTTGQTTLPDGRLLVANFDNWADTVRWLYAHIDGPPKVETKTEHSGGLGLHVTYDDVDDLPAPPASRAADDDA